MASKTAIIIGQPWTCERLERQLELLPDRPVTLGWVLVDGTDRAACPKGASILGAVGSLESLVSRRRPAFALVTLPASMSGLIQSIRTRLRRLGVAERFFPTLEDQLEGVGPRTHLSIDLTELIGRPPRPVDHAAIASILHGRRLLITGAGGSIGSELARLAPMFDPASLVLVDRSENALFEIDRQVARLRPSLSREAVLHDVIDEQETLRLFSRVRPEVVLHAAAHKHVPMMEDHPAAAVDNNLFGTKSVADAADQCGAGRFVMISTDKAVNPSSIMGATKRLAEMYIQDIHRRSETAFSMVRFGNVLGSSGSVLDVWSRQIAEGGPLTVTHPAMTRYFMTIPEAAALVLQSAALIDSASDVAEVFVLNMGEPVRIVDLASRYARLHGLEPQAADEAIPDTTEPAASGTIRIVFTGIRPGEKLHEELRRDAEALRQTRHPDIDIWALPEPEPHDIGELLQALSTDYRPRDPIALARVIRGRVPEMVKPAA